jgi:hypothetical protein
MLLTAESSGKLRQASYENIHSSPVLAAGIRVAIGISNASAHMYYCTLRVSAVTVLSQKKNTPARDLADRGWSMTGVA